MNVDILIDILRNGYQDILQHEISQCLISFLVACAVAVTSIPVIINFCDLLNLKEVPNLRSAHKELTPKFGGVAIFAGILIGHFLWPPQLLLSTIDRCLYSQLSFCCGADSSAPWKTDWKLRLAEIRLYSYAVFQPVRVNRFQFSEQWP